MDLFAERKKKQCKKKNKKTFKTNKDDIIPGDCSNNMAPRHGLLLFVMAEKTTLCLKQQMLERIFMPHVEG